MDADEIIADIEDDDELEEETPESGPQVLDDPGHPEVTGQPDPGATK